MSFDLNTATLIIGVLAFILAVFLKPMFMVARDMFIWFLIERYIFNDEFRKVLNDYSKELYYQSHYYREQLLLGQYLVKKGDRYCYITEDENFEPLSLTEQEHQSLKEQNIAKINLLIEHKTKVAKRSDMLDSLLRHYDQDKPNIIEEYIKTRTEVHEKYVQIGAIRKDADIESIILSGDSSFPLIGRLLRRGKTTTVTG